MLYVQDSHHLAPPAVAASQVKDVRVVLNAQDQHLFVMIFQAMAAQLFPAAVAQPAWADRTRQT